jgi:hypothetical protein
MTKKILTSLDLRGDILIGGTANSTSGYVLTSNGAGAISWAAASGGSGAYTLLSSGSGTNPFSFTGWSSTYKKLVVQFVITNIAATGFGGTLSLGVNSLPTTPYTFYNVGSGTANVSTSATLVPLTGTLSLGNKFTIEFPNWDGAIPTIRFFSGQGTTATQSRWGVASTDSAISAISILSSTGTWGTLGVQYWFYGVK